MIEGQAADSGKRGIRRGRFIRTVRWANFHFTEEGRTIYRFAKTLPQMQRDAVLENGKEFAAARSKRNFPRNVRNVAASLVVGQGMWYLVCPALSEIPGIRDSPLGWFAWGASDKLFVMPDKLMYTTGGYSTIFAAKVAGIVPKNRLYGALLLGAELAADISRCWTEYWLQKRYGVVPDGLARACGQVRPFPVRFSAIEVWQKAIGYLLRPWTIGTPEQIFSSMQGINGSLWRTIPQVGIVLTVGRGIDGFFKKIAEWTGLSKVAKRISESAERRERKALEAIEEVVGEQKLISLQLQLAAESRTFWKWNPFRPALSNQDAAKAAAAISKYREAQRSFEQDLWKFSETRARLMTAIGESAGALESVFGRKGLERAAPAFTEFARVSQYVRNDAGSLALMDANFEMAVDQLLAERRL